MEYNSFRLDYIPNIKWLKYKKLIKEYYASLKCKHILINSLGIKLKHSGYFAMIPNKIANVLEVNVKELLNYSLDESIQTVRLVK